MIALAPPRGRPLDRLIRLARLRAEIALDEEIIGDVASDLARKRQELADLEAIARDERAVSELAGQPVTAVTDDTDEIAVVAFWSEAR